MPCDGCGLPCTLKTCSCCCTLALLCTAAGGTGRRVASLPHRRCRGTVYSVAETLSNSEDHRIIES